MQQTLIALAGAAILGLGAQPALAQTRVFVSESGSDANPCSVAAPCRSFQQAHNTVTAGGEIVALDAAGYGPLNITKAVTVTAIGVEASITSNSASGAALSINAGSADVVTIRGLTLFGGAASNDGIDVNSAKSVTIRDCSLSGFSGEGILIDPSANLNANLRGVSADNNGFYGLEVFQNAMANVTILVTDSTFNTNGVDGVFVVSQNLSPGGGIKATLSVVAAANLGGGIEVASATGGALGAVTVMVTGSKLANNGGRGLLGHGAVQVFVDRTQISGNGTNGWETFNGAAVSSYKNNAVNGNFNDALNGVTQISSE